MIMSVLSRPYFHNDEAAFAHLESVLWTDGAKCPHCGSLGKHYDLRKTRVGLRKCQDCRKQFTVKVGTVFESAHIPLHKMLQAVYLMCASKKGVSAHQLHRILGITYKSAWFLAHRIREAMRSGDLSPMGGPGSSGIVEADETYIGRLKGVPKKGGGYGHKMKVMSLVERGGTIRSVVMDNVTRSEVERVIHSNVAKEARLMTDTARYYSKKGFNVADHETVNHTGNEYVHGEAHTNTLEGYYSIFKRGMKGVYQHCGEKHLHRYVAEFDFGTTIGRPVALRTSSALGTLCQVSSESG
jgi:transposase-like protein